MSSRSEFKDNARQAKVIYELIDESESIYFVFWFNDGFVCAAKKTSTSNKAAASLDFQVSTKDCLNDCGVGNFEGTTYQKGAEFLERLNR